MTITCWKSHWNSLETSQFSIVCLDGLQVRDCVLESGSLPKMTEMVINFWYVRLVAESDIWCSCNWGHSIVQIFCSNLWWKIILQGSCNGLIVLIDIGLSLPLGLLDKLYLVLSGYYLIRSQIFDSTDLIWSVCFIASPHSHRFMFSFCYLTNRSILSLVEVLLRNSFICLLALNLPFTHSIREHSWKADG